MSGGEETRATWPGTPGQDERPTVIAPAAPAAEAATLAMPPPATALTGLPPAGAGEAPTVVTQAGIAATHAATHAATAPGGTVAGRTSSGTGSGFRTRINGSLPPDNQQLDVHLQLSRVSVLQDIAERESDSLPEALRTRLARMESSGRYAVRRFLAAGGMGAVLEIEDNDFGRRSAVKIIKPGARHHPGILERFIEEARITARLEHPNIVPIHDMGVLADGTIFFTMKLIQGTSLGAVVKQLKEGQPEAVARWSIAERVLTFLKVLDGVGFAHSRQVVHRDLKPDNIMLDAHGEVLVVDWGIAKALQAAADGESPTAMLLGGQAGTGLGQTQHGQIMGSLHYMPPEQASGDLDAIGPRSDIYALGATLFELATLRKPRDGATTDALLRQAALGETVPLAVAAPDLDRDLAAVIARALEAAPADRYPDCAAFAADLRRFLEGRAVLARRRSLIERAATWIAEHRRQVAIAAGAVLLAAGGAVAAVQVVEGRSRSRAAALAAEAETLLATPDDPAAVEGAIERLGQSLVLVGSPATAARLEQARGARAAIAARERAAADAAARRRQADALRAEGGRQEAAGALAEAERTLAAALRLEPADAGIDDALRRVRRVLDDRQLAARQAEAAAHLAEGRARLAAAQGAGADAALQAAGDAFALAAKDGLAPIGLADAVAELALRRQALAEARAAAAKRAEAGVLAARARAAAGRGEWPAARDAALAALGLDPASGEAEAVRQQAVDRLREAAAAAERAAAGAALVQEAGRAIAAARAAEAERAAAEAERAAAAAEAERLAAGLAGRPAAAKGPLFAVRLRARTAAERAAAADTAVENQAMAAWGQLARLGESPERAAAAAILADLHLRRWRAAEAAEDALAAARSLAALRRFDDGSRTAAFDRPVPVAVRGAPPGGLTAQPLAEGADTRFAPAAGSAPAALGAALPAGRWRLAGGGQQADLWLRGGQPAALAWPAAAPALPDGLAVRWVADAAAGTGFWLGACEVTQEQYLAYVRASPAGAAALAMVAALRAGEAAELAVVPRTAATAGVWEVEPRQGPPAAFAIPAELAGTPVTGITRDDALGYCAWLSARSGLRVRLPTAAEWRLAASAGDPARIWPWGPLFDGAFTAGADGHRRFPARAGATATDIGPFGHRDLGGNVREWLAPAADDAGELNGAVAGGSWGDDSPQAFAARARERVPADVLTPAIGFRILIESEPAP